jgi:hypothetical protein
MNYTNIISEAMEQNYTNCYPLEELTISDLIKLSILAKGKVELRIRRETSNFHYGTLLEVQRFKDRMDCSAKGEKITYEA